MADKNHAAADTKGFKQDDGPKSGRIGRLDDQTLGYYRRVSDTVKAGFDTEEERELFCNNVFSQLNEEALRVSQNQTVSVIVEHLLWEATPDQLHMFLYSISKDWELSCTDRFISYVTQSVILLVGQNLSFENEETGKSNRTLFLELCHYLSANMAVNMQHTYASHVLRVMLEVLGGVKVNEEVIRSKVSRAATQGHQRAQVSFSSPSDVELKQLDAISSKIISFKKLEEHVKNYLANPVLQTLLLVLKIRNHDQCLRLVDHIIQNTDMFDTKESDDIPRLVGDEVASHLVEQILSVVPEEKYQEIMTKFKPNLLRVSIHPVANFVIQKLISNAHNEDQFVTIFKELSVNVEEVLGHNCNGIIVRLSEGCVKHSTHQDKFIKALQKAFHCYKPEERRSKLVQLVASFTTYDVFYKVPDSDDSDDSDSKEEKDEIALPTLQSVNIHGSLILQNMLQFANPKSIVASLLDLKPIELKTIACDPCGSHIIDAFMKSTTIGQSKEALYSRIKGQYLAVACNKNGSRTVDSLWKQASLKQRVMIAEELVKRETQLRSDRFGFFVWRNCAIDKFRQRRHEWEDLQYTDMNKRDRVSQSEGHVKRKRETDESLDHQNSPDTNTSKKRKKKRKSKKKDA